MAALQFSEGQQRPAKSLHSNAEQLLPNVVDGMASTRPEATYAIIPNSFTTYKNGYRKVTYRDLANAINGVAWLLSEQMPRNSPASTVAYIGPNDISYVVVILGAVKAGHSVLSVSPRNTRSDQASLFQARDCKTILTLAPPYSPTVTITLEALPTKPHIIHVPTIYDLIDQHYEHFPYPRTYETVKHEPLLTVHTSGTTNAPKPVTFTHAFVAAYTNLTLKAPPEGYDNLTTLVQSVRVFCVLPYFHAGCLFLALFEALMSHTVIVAPLAGVPPSLEVIRGGLELVDVDIFHMPSVFLEQIAKTPPMLEFVTNKVRAVCYGGGDVSDAVGAAFTSKINLANFIGSTEATSYCPLRPKRGFDIRDFKYVQFHPFANIELRPTGDPDLHEAVFVRNERPEDIQPIFVLYPDLQEYPTRDLWSPHPQKPGLWYFRGRSDDIIVSASGEMFNPCFFEQQISRLPEVAAALMVGTKRYQKALIVEPKDELSRSPGKQQEFIDCIWPTIDAANQEVIAAARIARSHVMVTSPDLPMQRAGKGTVQRARTVKLYQEQIDRLYDTAGDDEQGKAEPYKVHLEMRE